MSPEKARDAAKDALADIRKGKDPMAERQAERAAETVAELAEAWLAGHVKQKRKDSTFTYYQQLLDLHILPVFGSRRAISITRGDVSKLHGAIAAKRQVTPRPGGKRAQKTSRTVGGQGIANRALKTVSAMYGWGSRMGIVPEAYNPARGVEPFREEGKERFLSAEEMQRLGEALHLAETTGIEWQPNAGKSAERLKHVPKNRREVFPVHVTGAVRLLLLTGCRLREILNLEWQHVDWQRGLLRLSDSKTGKKVIILGGPALAVLRQLESAKIGRYVIASTTAGTKDEKPRADLQRPWKAICRAAGLDGLRLHDLRHSFASVGASGGLGLPVIGKLLGHADSATTQRYAHLDATAERRAADMIGAEIAAAMGLPEADVVSLDERRRA
jgi:integrase